MKTDASFRLHAQDVPEVTVDKINGGSSYIEFGTDEDALTIWGTEAQVIAIVSQFESDHTRRLTEALRRALNMPGASDLEVLLRGSLERSAA